MAMAHGSFLALLLVGLPARCSCLQQHVVESDGSTEAAPFTSDQPESSELGDASVEVRKSGVAGAGLGAFALRAFKKDEEVGRCFCTFGSTESQGRPDYNWKYNSSHSCDAWPVRLRNPMRYVNSIASSSTCDSQNVKARPDQLTPVPARGLSYLPYVAIRDISAGEEILVDYGQNYFDRPDLVAAGLLYECGLPELHVACGRGDVDKVRHLLSLGVPAELVNHQPSTSSLDNSLGRTPLMHAVLGGSQPVARLLIQEGANLNGVDSKGEAALYLVSSRGHQELTLLLLEHGADVNVRQHDGATPLFVASQKGHLDIVNALLSHGADVNAPKLHGATPLFIASLKRHLDIVSTLVSHGADVNVRTDDDATPLFIASLNGHLDVINALVSHGCVSCEPVLCLCVARACRHRLVQRPPIPRWCPVRAWLFFTFLPTYLCVSLGGGGVPFSHPSLCMITAHCSGRGSVAVRGVQYSFTLGGMIRASLCTHPP